MGKVVVDEWISLDGVVQARRARGGHNGRLPTRRLAPALLRRDVAEVGGRLHQLGGRLLQEPNKAEKRRA
jgi:hypothetical protein